MVEAGAPSPAPSSAPASASASADEGVAVHINAEATGVRLMRVAAQGYGTASNGTSVSVTSVVDVCGAPCDKVVTHPESQFYVAGDIVPSDPFRVEGFGRGVNLNVTTGSKGAFVLGVVLNYVGTVGLIAGGSLLLTAAIVGSFIASVLLVPGLIVTIGSAIFLGVGIPLTIVNKTRVEVTELKAAPPTNAVPVTLARF